MKLPPFGRLFISAASSTKNHIDFLPTPGASYQDTGFNFKVWSSAKRAYFTTEAFLHYRIDNEASSVNNPGKVMNVCYEYAEIEKVPSQKPSFLISLAVLWKLLNSAPITGIFSALIINFCQILSMLSAKNIKPQTKMVCLVKPTSKTINGNFYNTFYAIKPGELLFISAG